MSNTDDDLVLLLLYFMVDTSGSMAGTSIDAVNEIVPALLSTCQANPAVRDKLRFAVVEFNSTARPVVPLSKSTEVGEGTNQTPVPHFSPGGGTNYGAGFREVKRAIDNGLASIKGDGYKAHRPAVIIITDGDPTDPDGDRQTAWNDLVGPAGGSLTREEESRLPNVAIFGVADATEAQLKRYTARHGIAFKAADGVTASAALIEILKFLIQSIVTSVNDQDNTAAGSDGLTFDPDDLNSDVVVPVSAPAQVGG